ncbi:M20 family metallopeptidase [Verrucomicrobia bacterium]|nr:M20 family metallopeptidase [Verrucomicrobiota bacterium]MDB4690789.1 M20 family metallopeptidase [Verrucomicrobiota bacterium]MDB4778734.1 M20 family metallopeptidase [Verrucomicrobiota bacterium]
MKKADTKSAVSSLLMDLISIPSVNPAFCSDDALNGEKRVADMLAQRGAKLGLDFKYQLVKGKRSNLVLKYKPCSRPCHRLLLAPHMDTVVADEAQLNPHIKQGRIYGRGACDTKGSIAAMMDALAQISASPDRPRNTEIHLACLVDEEYGQLGSRAFSKRNKPYDLAIVGEPTSNKIVTAHKGAMWFHLQTRGLAAHGARPSLGNNAIHSMATAVQFLEQDYREQLNRRMHPLLGPATINVGTISGGKQPNIVPDACSISADRRTLPGESNAAIAKEILAALRKRGIKASLDYRRDAECPAMETQSDLPWIQKLMGLSRQKKPLGVDYFCDAAFIAQNGTPCIVFGPGSIDQAHTADEWISIRSLENCVEKYVQFFRSLP